MSAQYLLSNDQEGSIFLYQCSQGFILWAVLQYYILNGQSQIKDHQREGDGQEQQPFDSLISLFPKTKDSLVVAYASLLNNIMHTSQNSSFTPLSLFALVLCNTAPIDPAYSFASFQSTYAFQFQVCVSIRSVLLATTTKMTSFGAVLMTSLAHFFISVKERGLVTSQTNSAILAWWQQIRAMARHRYCPVVSHICSVQQCPGGCYSVFSINAAPRVLLQRGSKIWWMNLVARLDLPTADGPTMITFTLCASL